MLTPRPDKFRGARAYVNVGANALTFSGIILRPPASGLVLPRIGANQGSINFGIGPESALPAFTPGLAVVFTHVYPHWGADYAPTGAVVGGQFAAIPDDAFSFATVFGVPTPPFEVFPPNVVWGFSGAVAAAQGFALEWWEFLSAEELSRWPSSLA